MTITLIYVIIKWIMESLPFWGAAHYVGYRTEIERYSMKKRSGTNIKRLTYLAVMTAMVIILQLLGSALLRLGIFSVSLVLIPIVLGAAICGPLSGMWLGVVFGLTVLISGDAAFFMGFDVFGTIVTVLVKGALCGLCAGLAFRLLDKVNRYLAVVVSALVCPLVNTGVFVLGVFTFFMDDIAALAADSGMNAVAYIFLVLIGGNFIFELVVNILLCPAVMRLLKIKK